jgi:AraC-like DNA-binding protein
MYCDSIIDATQNTNHIAYPTTGYLLKGSLLYNESRFQEALDNYIVAHQWSHKKQDEIGKLESQLGIAAIKNIWGLEDEALEIYRSEYEKVKSLKNYVTNHYHDYILLVTNLSLSYIRNKKADSALIITESAMKLPQVKADSAGYFSLGKAHATANYYLKRYPHSLDSLTKFLPNYSGIVLSDSYFMMGKIAQYKNEHNVAKAYFKKMDSIHLALNDPFPELKKAYDELYKYAEKEEAKDAQLYYINRLIEVDSVLNANYRDINEKVRTDYDIPELRKQKHFLQNKITQKNKLFITSIVASLSILSVFIVYSYRRNKILKQKLEKVLEADVIEFSEFDTNTAESSSIGISKLIVDDILTKLNDFERERGFLSNDITLNSLAKRLDTNSSYLSAIINQEKQVNFSTYLKDLRIIHAINSIKNSKHYLKYSISGIAEEFGFTTAESFSKAFRKKTGIKPSYFLDELRKKYNDGKTTRNL